VELVTGTGHWYKAGEGVVPVRWVHVHDIQGTHRDDYIYSTDLSLAPAQIVSWFTARWPIETTFQEVRAHLGFETPRQRVANSDAQGTAQPSGGHGAEYVVHCAPHSSHGRVSQGVFRPQHVVSRPQDGFLLG